ncbi:ABC transporter ATP-binding protein [Photobacterium iliopiscarium]|jgi:putative thiamine transport system ATP-binding protein|uniref:ABC transporter ATP-binding protein n=1 Tax=Photobacterium iliopiscarium TaxID=56192 RepID=A0A0D8PX06_9GAMM|nr:ATP-binding cassette domain-containing protein [Photobacterium iliopiscarium]KJG13091.1 ABC transporter ATP-binding protein [Photobacterium iliopiscarium]KJG22517.1 ABC transporter ATP-binding protein [Photobacterium iliopiscarium]PST91447.1 ABC transporter ATP-binding protein [Photobacterium iliopiscarium]PSU00633.1 ABC transporter ATP-binding protein [Photobacterium iliopiscarium]PSV82319.1 ABC transporter ATP-binding protein [Photobacterium iliopiscarium]
MALSVSQLTLRHRHNNLIVGPLTFEVKAGQIMTLMGPSGSGKSTILSAIAGHLAPDFTVTGDIQLNKQSITSLAPNMRHIGIVFQDDLLFPHLNIWQNIAFGLPQEIKGSQRKHQALATLDELDLLHLQHQQAHEISGGQRARISMMRLLLSQPQAVLLDEPFSKLDKTLRAAFRQFVFDQIQQRNIPALMVTHDDDDIPTNGDVLNWPWQ